MMNDHSMRWCHSSLRPRKNDPPPRVITKEGSWRAAGLSFAVLGLVGVSVCTSAVPALFQCSRLLLFALAQCLHFLIRYFFAVLALSQRLEHFLSACTVSLTTLLQCWHFRSAWIPQNTFSVLGLFWCLHLLSACDVSLMTLLQR